jgi:hypothetical protein
VLLTALAVCVVTAAIVLQSDWLRGRLRRLAVSQAAKYLTGELTVGRLTGSLLHDVVLDDVTLTQDDGVVIHAARISVRYDWRALVQRHLNRHDLVVEQRCCELRRCGWNVGHLLEARQHGRAAGAAGSMRP